MEPTANFNINGTRESIFGALYNTYITYCLVNIPIVVLNISKVAIIVIRESITRLF